jgi:hypothetical protein
MTDYELLALEEYEDDAPVSGPLPGGCDPEVVYTEARVVATAADTPSPLVGKTVRVWDKGRYDYGVTGIITDTKPGDLWVRVWTDAGMAVWYALDDLTIR